MGYLLKEVLKMICGVNQWSYAVFWKIGCQNTKLLIWEEYYYEPNLTSLESISGFRSSDFPCVKQEGGWVSAENSLTQPRNEAGDAVHALIGKMMINNQVNVLGEGIVGRAAFTGHYQWVHSNNHISQAHPPEVLNELGLQFAAGMQTVAVIPVLPHGVVQLGSSLTIMENMAFVDHVKSMILQLGCISGALLSDGYASKESGERTGMHVSHGKPVSMDDAGNYNGTGAIPLRANTWNQHNSSSSFVSQPSHSLTQNQDNSNTNDIVCKAPSVIQTWAKSLNRNNQPNMSEEVSPDTFCTSGLDNGVVGAEVIPSNPGAWLNQHASSSNISSEIRHQTSNGQGMGQSNLKSFQERILSNAVFQHHDSSFNTSLENFVASQVKPDQCAMLNSCTASTSPQTVGSVLQRGMSSLLRSNAIPGSQLNPVKAADANFSCSNAVGFVSSGVVLPSQVDNMATSTVACGSSHPANAMHDPNEFDLFQALNIQLTDPGKHASVSEHDPSFATNFQNVGGRGQTTMSSNAEFEGTCGQHSSGNDLFDVLGAELKNNFTSCNGNKFITNKQKLSAKNLHDSIPGFVNMQDVGSSLYSVSGGITDSEIFSGTGADHLLDAVVSRAQPTSSQWSDDNLSCGTLTKISSSSIPSSTSTYSRVNRPQEKSFNFPKLLVGGGMSGSSSFISGSGFSKDNMGTCSQSSSLYGSEMSSWVEHGHHVKRESSVSTAYSKKPDQTSKSNRKRLKPGENPRPRPKDRQMIQDRVKELREIVPNGAKCSIDALLERTIKHMLFLQSVTKHADQLKQTGEPKIVNKEGGLALKENFEGGATWAFEVGSNSMVCPIIVEDLNPPRQLMVEMLCEERGFFLEIADLIRGMGLTILKGVMESRNDKIWARFAVEANRDVTRVEVFMSLVRLLEQTVKGNTSVNPSDNNLIINQSFPQAASVPVTSQPNSLL